MPMVVWFSETKLNQYIFFLQNMKKGSVNLLIIFGLLFLVIGITVPYLNWMGGATWYDSLLLLVIFTIIGSLLFLVGRSNQKESNLKESKHD
jgi:hypothetical protein